MNKESRIKSTDEQFQAFELCWDDLDFASPQLLGAITLVPVIKNTLNSSLRVKREMLDNPHQQVQLDEHSAYRSYIPHGFVFDYGSTEKKHSEKKLEKEPLRLVQRITGKKKKAKKIRVLPFHMAMEGFLSIAFSPPKTAHAELSDFARKHGLGFRCEWSCDSSQIPGLHRAMQIFEIHEKQVGMLLFVNNSLSSSFIVSHPDDYRKLHFTLLQDSYSELIAHYSELPAAELDYSISISDHSAAVKKITSIDALERSYREACRLRDQYVRDLTKSLFNKPIRQKPLFKLSGASLFSFHNDLKNCLGSDEAHIGEALIEKGKIQYLKSYRLSSKQLEKGAFLQILEESNWSPQAVRWKLNLDKNAWQRKIQKLGLSYLFNNDNTAIDDDWVW